MIGFHLPPTIESVTSTGQMIVSTCFTLAPPRSMIFLTISDSFAYLFLSFLSCRVIVAGSAGFDRFSRPAELETYRAL
jgi:hypothetical protein